MISYAHSVDALIGRLANEKNIAYKHRFFNPILDEKIVVLESKYSVKVSEELRAFYQKSNGFQLIWAAKTSPYYNKVEDYLNKVAWDWGEIDELHWVDFKLELLPLEQAINKGITYLEEKANTFERLDLYNGLLIPETCRSDLKYQVLKYVFPEVDLRGADTSSINKQLMFKAALNSKTILNRDLNEMIRQHHLFLDSGGIGGTWKTLSVGQGLVLSVYTGVKAEEGKQINLARRNLSGLDMKHLDIPYADLCGCYGENINFSGGNLSHSLVTDVFMEKASFEATNFSYSDFSRANLKQANFKNANLNHCDFENACLDGADFRGAKWLKTSFKGASVEGLMY